jgi:uncharacterized membrane protein YgdD (TMEM256/DUF423 family)
LLKNLVLASVLGCLSVVSGAFGAHALEDLLSPESLKSYETGVRYMMLHSIVILFLNGSTNLQTKTRNRLSYLFFSGILFFSGSIFAISLGLVPASSIWFITPLGGLLLISGWIGMAFAFLKQLRENKKD